MSTPGISAQVISAQAVSAQALGARTGPQGLASNLAADARSLEELKRSAKSNPDAAIKKAASQFEAVFMNMLLKSMREALPNSDPLASEGTRMMSGMLDQQYAQNLSGKGLGLAELMVKQLTRNQSAASPRDAQPVGLLNKLNAANVEAGVSAAKAGPAAAPAAGAAQDFVRRNLGNALEAQKESGIPAHFILGQAALESGWGKREIRAADGSPSHNLFGIKASRDWKGATASATTTEYVDGVAKKTVEKFRAYGSYAEAFRDYAKLLAGNPRYAAAVGEQRDAAAFARNIQAAGYATDPLYAQKLTRVIQQTMAMQGVA
jgi:flagellar protein FlgJ